MPFNSGYTPTEDQTFESEEKKNKGILWIHEQNCKHKVYTYDEAIDLTGENLTTRSQSQEISRPPVTHILLFTVGTSLLSQKSLEFSRLYLQNLTRYYLLALEALP